MLPEVLCQPAEVMDFAQIFTSDVNMTMLLVASLPSAGSRTRAGFHSREPPPEAVCIHVFLP